MRHSLHSHIIHLENTIQRLTDRLTLPHLSQEEREGLEVQIAMAERALERYREAYELELRVADPEPPNRPGAESGGATGNSQTGKPPRKKEGLAATGPRARTSRRPTLPVWRALPDSAGLKRLRKAGSRG